MAEEKRGPDDDLIPIGPWLGVDQISDERSLGSEYVRAGVNFDFLKGGVRRTRLGQTLRLALTDPHSLWSNGEAAFLVEAGALCPVDVDEWSLLPALQSGLSRSLAVSYTQASGSVYWSNGEVLGRIRDGVSHAWGLPVPGRPVVAATAGGNMTAGRYLLAVVFVSDTGEESGASAFVEVDVAEGGGIQLTMIPQTAEAEHVRLYLSKPNAQVLYRRLDISMGVTAYSVGAGRLGVSLKTENAARVPAGQCVRYFNGQLFIAVGNRVVRSLTHKYGLYVPDRDVWPFNDRVAVMEPAGEAGLWVVADKSYFIRQGERVDPRAVRSAYGAVEGTGLQVPADVLGLDGVFGEVPVWVPVGAHAALVAGLPDGSLKYFGKDKVALSEYGAGSVLLLERDGLRTLVAALREKGDVDRFGAEDNASITIYRGGVAVS